MVKKNALGRGLGALLSDSETQEKSGSKDQRGSGGINEIPVEQVDVNPFQPREQFDEVSLKELAESIKVHGIIQPITVRQLSAKKFQLISGERRLQASKLAGLKSVPAYVRTADDQQMLEMALIENIQRENLNAIEIALSYQRLMTECKLKQEELGDRVGKNRSTVTNYLRLLKLPPDIQIGLRDNTISMGHARALITMEDPAQQLAVFQKIIKDQLSVRQVETLVRKIGSITQKPGKTPKSITESKEVVQLQSRLSSHFGSKIKVVSDGKKGEIKIPFVSVDDLNRILEILDIS